MNTALQDTIEREIMVRAPRERVYSAIADADQIVKWFPERVEGKMAVGERPIFDFGKYGKVHLYVVAAQPYEYFAYRWLPGSEYQPGFEGDVLSKPNTLVEFRLEDAPDGTRVRLKESGFASLPPEAYEKAFADNSEGWTEELAKLVKLFA
jgi:uncharacterized protein YndB with AHSA1/START domain